MPHIQFTPFLAKELKKAYKKAVEQEKESFMFCGHKLVTGYAKYMIQHLEMNVYKQDLDKLK